MRPPSRRRGWGAGNPPPLCAPGGYGRSYKRRRLFVCVPPAAGAQRGLWAQPGVPTPSRAARTIPGRSGTRWHRCPLPVPVGTRGHSGGDPSAVTSPGTEPKAGTRRPRSRDGGKGQLRSGPVPPSGQPARRRVPPLPGFRGQGGQRCHRGDPRGSPGGCPGLPPRGTLKGQPARRPQSGVPSLASSGVWAGGFGGAGGGSSR